MKRHALIGLGVALALAVAGPSLIGQTGQPAASVAGGPFESLHFRQIGPASMSGRISDLAVYEANPAIFYVGTAHGGVWKTTNAGTTFEAQFQDQGLMSIGDVTISQSNPDLVWVGTGESNNRQSTSWGDGVYKSTDGGKTYVNMGLRTSKHIHRIAIDPRDNNIVFVAATGSLWGPGGERGVYRTADGGKTWKQVLKVDDDTGANDLAMDPANSKIVYASTYQRRRTACCMNGGGPGSGIWKSTDGGETWTRLKGNGMPEGPLGRIALEVSRKRRTSSTPRSRAPRLPAARAAAPAVGAAAAGPGAAARGGGEPARPRKPGGGRGGGGRSTPSHRRLPLGRCGRDVAQGEQREPAADVLQQGPHRSERPRGRLPRRRRPAPVARRRQDDSRPTSRPRPTTTCTPSGSTRRTRTTC